MDSEYPSNENLLTARRKYCFPTTAHYYRKPLQLVRGRGEHVYDDQGREYLDAIGGILAISVGHNHPRIKTALMQMLERDEIQHTTVLYLNRHMVELAESLVAEAPEGLDRASFTNSGSEANELAMMVCRHATREMTVISLRLGYHGGTAAAQANTGQHTWRFSSQPVTAVTMAVAPYCYRCPFGQTATQCSLECAQNVEDTIQTTTNGKFAAFIAEPVMGVGGFIAPPDAYFHEAERIVHQYGGCYISDEVQTGVGRCGGAYFLTKEMGLKADAITLAKGFGNGAPIGAVVMRSSLAEPMKGRLYFNTFAGDPYQTAQAKLTLDIVREERLIDNAKLMGKLLRWGLESLMSRHSLIGDVRGRGLMVGLELVKDRKTKACASEECLELMERCRDKGLLVGKGGLFGNVIRIAPALTLKKDQAERIVSVIDESLTEMARKP